MKKLIIMFVIFSFLASCSQKEEVIKKYYKTSITQSGNVLDSESYVGYTDSFNNVQLSPKIGGKIVSINKNVGDKVKVGEVVAVLDGIEAKTGFNSSLDIISSLETLKNSTSQMFDEQIKVMEGKIKSAQTGIEIANEGLNGTQAGTLDTKNITKNQIITLESQIATAQTGLESARLQLENTKNSLDQKENDIYTNSKNAISNANILGNNLINFLDNLFGVTDSNKGKNDSYEIYISAKNTSIKNEIETDFKKLNQKFNEIKKLQLNSNEDIKNTLVEYNNLFSNEIRNILKKSFEAMENSVESTNFTQNMIDGNKTQITNFQNQNEQIILTVSGDYFLGLKGSLDSINNFGKQKKSSLDSLEKQVELATKQIETLNQTKNQINAIGNGQLTDITTKNEIAKKQVLLSQNSLDEAIAGLEALKKQKNASLGEIDAKINQVNAGKNDAGVMIENGKIISLIDGIVTKKLQEVGNTIGAGMPILIVSSNDKIKIELQIPEELLQNIQIGNLVKVEIEGIGEIKTGIITKILPTRDNITKKSSIEITIDNLENDIKIGSYSKIYFDNIKTQSGIIIPNNAIISKFMIPQVFVIENKKAKLKNIEILKQNDNFSQINGLNIGEKVITEGKENIFDGEILQN